MGTMLKNSIGRYFAGWRELPFLWKAGVLCSVAGITGWLILSFTTPITLFNTPGAAFQRKVCLAFFLFGMLMRVGGAVQHTRNVILRKRR